MKQKQFTIAQLEAQMQESINFIFGCKAHISHGLCCTRGNKILYGKHTDIEVPIEGFKRVITKQQVYSARLIIAKCYDKVTRVVVERGAVSRGGNSPACRSIRFEH